MQKGDVKNTFSDVSLLKSLTDFAPRTSIKTGINEFVKWYKKIMKNKDYIIGIVGLGYVGLPLAIAFGRNYKTLGFDVSKKQIY